MQSATTKTIAEKGREITVDLAIDLGIPLLEIGLGMFVHVICAQILSLIIAQDMLFKVSFQYLRGHRLLPGDLQHLSLIPWCTVCRWPLDCCLQFIAVSTG
jgi:hypothetical protein